MTISKNYRNGETYNYIYLYKYKEKIYIIYRQYVYTLSICVKVLEGESERGSERAKEWGEGDGLVLFWAYPTAAALLQQLFFLFPCRGAVAALQASPIFAPLFFSLAHS